MNKTDFQALIESNYNRKQLCFIILLCLNHINELNQILENGKAKEEKQAI